MNYQSLVLNTLTNDVISLGRLITNEYQITQDFSFLDNNPDLLIIQKTNKSIGIGDVKPLLEWSNLKPFQSQVKVAIVLDSDRMTPQAQNSLLKLIEEPSPNTIIALHSVNKMSLLPTILSRTRDVYSNEHPQLNTKFFELVEHFVHKDLNQKFLIVDELLSQDLEREELIYFVGLIPAILLKDKDIHDPSSVGNMLKFVKQALIGIRAGTNARLTLESLAISIKEQS